MTHPQLSREEARLLLAMGLTDSMGPGKELLAYRVELVLALHSDLDGSCQECQWAEYPCATRRLLAPPPVSTTS